VHSVYRPGRWLTGNYWDEAIVLPSVLTGRAPRSIAILGNAAGTVARTYGHYFPGTRIDGVEIDRELTDVGRRLFDLRAPNLRLHTADARPFLRDTRRRWDAILVDAYRQPYIPFYLATEEFFRLVRSRLNPGGIVMVNVGHPERSDALERVLSATMRRSFPAVLRDPSERVNTMLVGLRDGPRSTVTGPLPADLLPVAAAAAERVRPGLAGGTVYTDDRAPVEWLIDGSILKVAAEGSR
jgi:predicted O-methyltransferase YrrM